MVFSYNPTAVEAETGGSWGSMASKPRLLDELRDSGDPISERTEEDSACRMAPKVALCP